jgi:hypothetical protein
VALNNFQAPPQQGKGVYYPPPPQQQQQQQPYNQYQQYNNTYPVRVFIVYITVLKDTNSYVIDPFN